MKKMVYGLPEGNSASFLVQWNEEGQMVSCRCPGDADGMDWVKKGIPWGTVVCGEALEGKVMRSFTAQGRLRECWEIYNGTNHDIYAVGTCLGICIPLPDFYTDANYCMSNCCHVHVWCGGRSSYLCAMKMGGGSVNLGLVLTEGSLQGYSVRRNLEESSNDRGTFILHPEDMVLHPGESYVLSWEIFWFRDREEFSDILESYGDFVSIQADRFVVAAGEPIRFLAKIGGAGEEGQTPVIERNGMAIPCRWEAGCAVVEEEAGEPGEYCYEICWKGQRSKAVFRKYSSVEALAGERCRFLAEKQQCMDEKSFLYGAWLIYDNEDKKQYYSIINDYNGGRERVGMAVLMARYLQKHPDQTLEKSLALYMDYLMRELYVSFCGMGMRNRRHGQKL